ncbi:hypothetical protein LUX73_07080 [Actinomadura madurae]|nr:hypothetical protein [Actinomadura madurae]MCQ0004501.1 hypothetical protein [Actinomadura madurae]
MANAPSSTSTTPARAAPPPGGSATSAEIRYVPAACPSRTKPASITRPNAVVVSSACVAARRSSARSGRTAPIRMNELSVVSSQNTYRTSRLSASTRPVIAPANATSVPVSSLSERSKYQPA